MHFINTVHREPGEVECEVYRATTLTASLLLFPRLKRKRRDLRGASFLPALGEKQPALPDSTLKRGHEFKISIRSVKKTHLLLGTSPLSFNYFLEHCIIRVISIIKSYMNSPGETNKNCTFCLIIQRQRKCVTY